MSITCCPLDSGGDGDPPSVYDKSTPRAAKAHRCSECSEEIPKGAPHELVRACWDGSWSTFRTCASCVEIRDHFACDGFVHETLWDDLGENFLPSMRAGGPCLEGLSPAAKARLFARRLAWLETPAGRDWLAVWADNVVDARVDARQKPPTSDVYMNKEEDQS